MAMPRALRVRAVGARRRGERRRRSMAGARLGPCAPPLQIRVLVELHDVVYDSFEKLGHPCDLSRGRSTARGASARLLVILGLILAVASAVATNLAFLFKHRGAVLAPPRRGPPSAAQRRRSLSLHGVPPL